MGVDGLLDRAKLGGEFVVIRVDVDHQHIARVDALEGSGVVVSRLAAVRDELVADVPLGVQSDATWEAPFLCALLMYRKGSPLPAESSAQR